MKTTHKLSLLALAATLAACGGGGDTAATGGTPVVVPAANSVPLQTTVPAATYAPGSDVARAFAYLNAERLKCGFGALAQNTALDQAALAHAKFIVAHPASHPHNETPGLSGFTGVTTYDRAIAAGYKPATNSVTEVGSGYYAMFNLQFSQPDGSADVLAYEGVRRLLSAPYHMMGLVSSVVDVGFGLYALDYTTNGMRNFESELYLSMGGGASFSGQMPPAGTGVRTYPCEGVTNAKPALYGEWTENPAGLAPGRILGLNPVGQPIMVIGEPNKTLALLSTRITDVATGQDTAIYQMRVKSNDPNPAYYRDDWTGYVLPDKPFTPGHQYTVVITGTSGGTPFTKTFTFGVGQPSPSGK